MKTYTVWFDQVNAQVIEIRARDVESAATKAEAQWKRDHTPATIRTIEQKKEKSK